MRPDGATLPPTGSDETLAGTGGVAPRREQPTRPGEMVGRYVVLEQLGRGAMGVVYKAIDPKLDRAVAVKLLLGEGDEAGRQRLTREAQSIAKVSHPNVIAVHDVGTHEGRVFFAMELVDGLPLKRWLQETSPEVEAVIEVFRQAGAGLAAAHAAGLVHRDFKPDNVLVGRTGRARVLDFGLARHGDEEPFELDQDASVDSVHLTRTGAVMGTPAYMAPEQFAGEPADAKSDQFAFCVALHEALTGRRPYEGNTLAILSSAVLRGHRTETHFTGVPQRVVDAIDRGLSHAPEQRFASMDDLLAELAPRTGPRWGRLAFAGTAVLAVATATAYGIGRERGAAPPPDPCADATEPIDAHWNADRRLELTEAFAVSGAHNADFMAARVEDAVDAYAARWRDAAAQSCQMVQVDRALGTELAFRSEHCVTSTLEAFGEQLDALAELDAKGLQSALDDVEWLESPANCVDPRMLELRVLVPSDPDLREDLQALKPAFQQAIDDRNASNPQACLDVIRSVEAKARDLGHGPSVTYALDIRASCERAAGLQADAQQTLLLTFEEALASGHDEAAIGVAADIAYGALQRTDDYERAEAWLRRAEALARRHGIEDSRSMRSVVNVRGTLAGVRGEPEESVQWFEKLAEMTRDAPDGASAHLSALLNVGATLANAGQTERALESFEAAAAFAEQHWGREHEDFARAQSKLAQGLLLAGRVDEARAPQRAAVAVMERFDLPSLPYANALYSMTMIESRLGDLELALDYGRRAYRVYDKMGASETTRTTELLNALSDLERRAGNLDEAERYARECLAIREKFDRPLETVEPLMMLTSVHIARDELPQARALLQRAEGLIANEAKGTRKARRGPVTYRLAARMHEAGNEARALQLFARAEAYTSEDDDGPITNELRLKYARILAEKGRVDEAKAVLGRVETTIETSPYPPSIVEDARALREELGL